MVQGNDLRLSPLIADIGNDVAQNEALQCRRTAAEHWLSIGALNQRTLPLCFWNAFWGNHTWIVANLCQVMETLTSEQLRGTAALLSPITFFRTDRSIYPDVPEIGTMLRLLQFDVANAIENSEVAGRAARRLMIEIEEVNIPEVKPLHKSVAIPKILLAEHADIEPAMQLNLALHLRAVLQEIDAMNDPELSEGTASLTTGFPAGVDLPGFLFAAVVNRIRSSARMLEMIEALSSLNESDRNNFIDAAAIVFRVGGGSFVHNGWAQEQLDNQDLRPTLERFELMAKIASRWNRLDIQNELACARSVILDEGLGDQLTAIAVVEDAMNELGSTPTLIRQKAKVLGHAGDDAAAARLLMKVEDTIGADSPLDRALALRDGGVSAARAELFSDAVRLFLKAREVLMNEGLHPALAVGVQIEIALVRWAMHDHPSAIVALADALDAVEPLDPASSRKNERAHQFTRASIGIFWNKLDPYFLGQSRNIAFGQASALTGDEPLLGVDLTPLARSWRLLALCEIEIGLDLGIERRSVTKQTGPGLALIEMFIARARYARAVANKDFSAAFRLGLLAISAFGALQESRAVEGDEASIDLGQLESNNLRMLPEGGLPDIVRTIPVDLLVWHRFRDDWDAELVSRIERACVAAWGDSASISDILRAASGHTVDGEPVAIVALAASLASPPDLRGNPRARFERDLLLIFHAAHSLARRVLEPLLVAEIVEGWSIVSKSESFALRAPMQHTPAIEAAISDTKSSGLRGAARLMLAASPAVRTSLTENWIQLMRQISGDESLPSP